MLLKVSVAALEKFSLSRVKSVSLFHLFSFPFDLFGDFTDFVFFSGFVLKVTELEFSEIKKILNF